MFARLFDHLCWADRKVLESLRSAQNPPAKALELYSHVLGSEHVWLSRIHGVAAELAVWPSLTLAQCEKIASDNCEAFTTIVKTLTPDSLAGEISYRNSAGAGFTSTLEDILTHVALHGSYHRGQIAVSLRAAGETPSPTDYIAFARGSPAATRTNG
ncbi:MAG: DinB family protein [Gemmatimonadaceae bacterium]